MIGNSWCVPVLLGLLGTEDKTPNPTKEGMEILIDRSSSAARKGNTNRQSTSFRMPFYRPNQIGVPSPTKLPSILPGQTATGAETVPILR